MLEDGWSQHILLVVSIEKDIVEHSKYPIDWHRPEVEAGESCKTVYVRTRLNFGNGKYSGQFN